MGNPPPAYGGGIAETVLHPVVLVAMLLSILLILTLPRRRVIVPFLCFAFLVPLGQQVYVGGVHWLALRIVILAGVLRLIIEKSRARGVLFPDGFNGIDRAFVLWALYSGLAPILLFQEGGAIPGQIAFWLEAFGGYFLLRYLIQDVDDIATVGKTLALVVLILSACMATERYLGLNIFGYTHSTLLIPVVRDGLIRAQACFGTPILAGCFGATLLPLFYWLWKSGRANGLATVGTLGAVMMLIFSASSTPLMASAGGIGALLLWPVRRSMRTVRWGIVFTVVALHIAMKAPVWFLIARINPTGASDAYGRAILIDNFVRHFSDWWLIGTHEAANWGWNMWDACNGFVAEGETGGLVGFICFLALFWRSFSRLGKMRRQVEGDKEHEWLCWCLGAVLFATILAFLGVSYFDQTQMLWFAVLAMVSGATAAYVKRPACVVEVEESVPAIVTL